MTTYKVKSWSHFFQAIKAGKKLHDLRDIRDRDYKVGDILILQEYLPFDGDYTGDEVEVEITYITSNKTPCAFSSSALDKNYAILSLKLLNTFIVPDCENPDNPPEIKYGERPEVFMPLPEGRKLNLVAKGGPIDINKTYFVRESPEDFPLNQDKYLKPVSPNPNAEYYQNG